MKRGTVTVSSRILVYTEDGQYVAHAIDMDLIGEAPSPNGAVGALKQAIEAQVSFAVHKGNTGMVYFKCSRALENRWIKAAEKGLHDLAKGDDAKNMECIASFIELSQAELNECLQHA